MPIINRIADLLPDLVAWRRDLHANPELGFEVHRTAAFVADRLREFGCDRVITGIGKTGVVGVITGKRVNGPEKTIGLRADMDALPIQEATNLPFASTNRGVMHACGHDGHTAMLLGAARYLSDTRNFAGTVVLIFEPAEELGTGAAAMLADGLMENFGIQQVYGMHNLPGMPVGVFGIRQGAAFAGTDIIGFKIEGRGGHHGLPHKSIDPILVGAQLITAIQQILAQNVDPVESAGFSFDSFHSGDGLATIAETAELSGTIRALKQEVRDIVLKRLGEVVAGISQVTGAKIHVTSQIGEIVLVNQPEPTKMAVASAIDIAGEDNVLTTPQVLTGDDFARLAKARPGAYIWCGNGDGAGLHHAAYDFNDDAIPFGTSYWIRLVENTLL
ncbi:amidohydrolase [Mesorhizobium sp. WSM3882]|uniref:amidohydrolase n=1 Tax=Mesorhizobium sp. WSM3882 TaxID=2029407 RepID=UPI000BB034EF|nr:amidohydrolase [Mesorhizobium sp. WSM3882]PBB28940.1 amidohydrolase [Mesorhizobium sp. WSM3882]